MPHSQDRQHCERVLKAFLEALRSPDPDRLSLLPERMQVQEVSSGTIRHEEEGACSVKVDVQVGELRRHYVLSVHLENQEPFAALRDPEGVEEEFMLSDPQDPLDQETIQALYDALATDIASHFGTDS